MTLDGDRPRPIGDHDPIMLRDAARLMFPDGTVNEKTLRRLRDRGQLDCSRIRGRDYTTLSAMRTMMERTRVPPKVHQRTEVRRPDAASDEPGNALAALMTRCAAVRDPPTQPRGKHARKPPEPPGTPRTRKRQLTPRIPRAPASEP